MEKYCVVMTTCDSEEQVKMINETILKNKLGACIQITNVNSFFFWENKVDNSAEFLMLIKTRTDLYDLLEQAIKSVHNYETPEIIAIPIIAGSTEYLKWIEDETRK